MGRQPELDQIITLLLRSARLVTLIGPGGIGKTRLASEAVARFQRSTHTPVHWVRLARLAAGSGAAAVEEELAHALMETDFSSRSGWQAIIDALSSNDGRAGQTVLVMDNCEHVLDGVGEVADRLLGELPHLSILATSRGAIGWIDEHRFIVPPLSDEQAVALFKLRSELIGRPVISPDQREVIAAICRHVNNHPLYIRLAAARLVRQPLPVILADLTGEPTDDQRMWWMDAPRVGTDPRHRGVRDVISWSYDLCDVHEQVLLERMSVFAAGYDVNPEDSADGALDVGAELEAIEEVCSDPDGTVAPAAITRGMIGDLLDQLVDRSLVSIHITPTAVRYSLLESIRIFAQDRLARRSRDERPRLERRHLQYYRDKVAFAATHWCGPDELELVDSARAAWANISTAVDRAVLDPEQAVLALEICRGLLEMRLPFLGCSFREIRQWTERALSATTGLDTKVSKDRENAFSLLTWIALCQGVHEDAAVMLEECARLCLGDPTGSVDWRQSAASGSGLSAALECAWGFELLMVKSDPDAIAVFGRAVEKFREEGNIGRSVMAELFGAIAAGLLGTDDEAETLSTRHLARAEGYGGGWLVSWARLARAVALTRAGKLSEALHLERLALECMSRIRDQWGGLWAAQFRIWTLARVLESMRADKPDRARRTDVAVEIAQLAGGTSAFVAEAGIQFGSLRPFASASEQSLAIARETLGEKAFAAALAQGRELRMDRRELHSLAMGELPLRRQAPDPAVAWNQLSPAESDVAVLAAAGWTNTAIAVRRGSSIRTVDSQIASVLNKLTISSRDEIGRLVPPGLEDRVRAEALRRPERQRRPQL
ncbi:hypothetical protein NN3_41720 [Nocardia neocaledoniensis NBRC 108232]|uniref:Putative ATPase n=1 Tax=Nocardia neocaledoniensis TaxID=236511 RepID=A0A317NIQ7_9NOCA|nr:AAA family ATPase [Nocardia neocaledoniensis]PWV74524.1 putative ATPase [Nocardia neocaledoniensis]GEM33165.1 hypothetical protein NN3_41720 [Nocardia neocaledoniensis NBRC 108232]